MTEIYEVEAPGGRCLAKLLRPEFVSTPQIVDRMRLEADVLSAIDHPNVVHLFDRGITAEKRPYLVLERLSGHTLRRELVRRGALPVLEAVDLVLQALAGLGAVHRLGVVHRDLKPDNLFLSRAKGNGPSLKILDFGFAKVLAGSKDGHRIAPLVISTAEREFVGGARYVSPEQLLVGQAVDHRADIYTLGLVLYTLVLGREPHHDVDSRSELLRAHLEGRLEPPSQDTVERISKELLRIIWRATSTAPGSRFWSAEEFASELRQFADARHPAAQAEEGRTLTIQQHAEMTAAIEADPANAKEARTRFGINSAKHLRAVDAWWKKYVEADAKVHVKWRALVDRYLVEQRRSARRKS
jgi:serine/threonine-protein kinase